MAIDFESALIEELAISRAEQSLTPVEFKKHCVFGVARDLVPTELLGESPIAPILFEAMADSINAERRFVDEKEKIKEYLQMQL